ncbi:MAG: hypothetical protein JJK56_08245 [Pseudomonas sp.]|uniref:hypothetical protein n=1 Tax=Pseudomonas sp. TaxID=306 RepID=UPI001A5769C5|nr:hypothetical protein [Pseudomonas sp.]MBL7227975.1 hypothetical protein [Pseudomonas sp.]
MRFSSLFHLECAPLALDDTFHYVVLSTLQWKTPNLDLMATASKQRFAVLYNQPLEDRFAIESLEQAHIQGAMSGVKLVSVHKDVLRIFLSDEVAGATFPAIEALWEPIKELDLNRRLEIDFSCEHEVYSGRSEYLFWSAVKVVLESNSLGIERYATPVLHDCAEEISSGDDPSSHQYHLDIRQSFSSEAVMHTGFCPHVPEHVDSMVGHSKSSMLEFYICPHQKWRMP